MLLPNVYLFICSVVSFIFGMYILFSKKPPKYFNMILFAIACQLFSRIYYIITFLCYGGLPEIFNIGFIGFGTFFLCILFSNYGLIDLLIDEKHDTITKYDILAAIIPVIEILFSVIAVITSHVDLSVRLSYVCLSVLAACAGYFNLKHFLIPDTEGGIANALRNFNFICVLVEICMLMEVGLHCFSIYALITPMEILLGILLVAILPVLYKGVFKWTH